MEPLFEVYFGIGECEGSSFFATEQEAYTHALAYAGDGHYTIMKFTPSGGALEAFNGELTQIDKTTIKTTIKFSRTQHISYKR